MDFNTILSINQSVHNAGAALFGAGPFYFLLLLSRGRAVEGDFSFARVRTLEEVFGVSLNIWIVFLIIQALSGAAFGFLSLAYEGAIPEVSAIAMIALLVKVLSAAGAFFITVYLKLSVAPRLRALVMDGGSGEENGGTKISQYLALEKHRTNLIWALTLLGALALTGAAFLRWNL
ncbi:MAG: hypothetical protein ACE5EB_02275 [Thermodesulfobacteriota bacterium]